MSLVDKLKNNLIYIILIVIVILIPRYNSIKSNIRDKFTNTNNKHFLKKCFDQNTLNSFKKYKRVSSVLQIPHGIVFTTPNQYIDLLPQISWNGIFLNNLCVDPKMRNKGLGTKLVLMVINSAKKLGKDHVILQVKKNNIPAIKIYKKLGFRKHSEGLNKNGKKVIVYVYYL